MSISESSGMSKTRRILALVGAALVGATLVAALVGAALVGAALVGTALVGTALVGATLVRAERMLYLHVGHVLFMRNQCAKFSELKICPQWRMRATC